jgi:hypothetical protein
MRRYFFLTSFLLCSICSLAQRHTKGVRAYEGLGGISKYGQLFLVGHARYLSSKTYLKVNVHYAMAQSDNLKHNSVGLNVSFHYSLPVYRNVVYASALGGVGFSNDKLGAQGTDNDFSTFKFSLVGGVELETFFSNKVSFIINANHHYLTGKYFGDMRWYATAGVRFHFLRIK